MAINPADFELLRTAFGDAKKNKVLLYDIMTERFEITSMLVSELMRERALFGKLEQGSADSPAVVMDSVHYLYKEVAGKPLIRPAWFFDVRQEGEAIQDVGTHLIDAVQHHCFPEQALDWQKDIKVSSAKGWATKINTEQFKRSTGLSGFPDFLTKDLNSEGSLDVFCNGEVNYTLRGVHAKVIARWDFEAPVGAKDSLYAKFQGSGATLLVRQRAQEKYIATVYIEPAGKRRSDEFEKELRKAVHNVAHKFPGLDVAHSGKGWHLVIPENYMVGHESHFAQVTERYLEYLRKGKLPAWEVPNMLAKYYTTTEAYRLSHR
jgi:predicted dehydrogenase